MYLVYEVVDAECMEAKINEDDMRLFSSFKNAMDYAERRRKSLIDDGLIFTMNLTDGADKICLAPYTINHL